MNDEVPNESDAPYATLTSGLLARKGQAQPAFDRDAYAEVMSGHEFTAPLSPIFTKTQKVPAHPSAGIEHNGAATAQQVPQSKPQHQQPQQIEHQSRRRRVNVERNRPPGSAPRKQASPKPDAGKLGTGKLGTRTSDTRVSGQTTQAGKKIPAKRSQQETNVLRKPFSATPAGKDHAAVLFRMSREEYKRLRRAAAELEMSSYRILLDAVECYLDANEVEPIANKTEFPPDKG